jgi:hypothetical protein
MLSSKGNNTKFKMESSSIQNLTEIEFFINVYVTDKEAKNCFKKIESIFNNLKTITAKASIPETKILISDPSETSQGFKKFEISSELGLKNKMNVTLDIRVIVSFDTKMNFWDKGLSLSSTIDLLELFCENIRKEKNIYICLNQAQIPEKKKENIS